MDDLNTWSEVAFYTVAAALTFPALYLGVVGLLRLVR